MADRGGAADGARASSWADVSPGKTVMGLLEKFFFRNWPHPLDYPGPPDLTLDLARGALGTLRLNDSVELLKERLGPPASWNRMRKGGQWLYPELGVSFDSDEGLVNSFDVVPRKPEGSALFEWSKVWKPWSGTILFADGFRVSGLEAKLDDFLGHAGKPAHRENEDHEDILLQYDGSSNFPEGGFDVEFTPEGELLNLELYG